MFSHYLFIFLAETLLSG